MKNHLSLRSLFAGVLLAWLVPTVATADVAINEQNFPDANFRNFLREQDYGQDGVITDGELMSITSMAPSNRNISSLEGIKYFTILMVLSCENNQLTSLDVSGLRYLTRLHCSGNSLTSLDVSNCPRLEEIYCHANSLKGASMDAFIETLMDRTPFTGTLYIYNEYGDGDNNVCTKSQVAAIKAKMWTPYYVYGVTEGGEWRVRVYEGSEDTGIVAVETAQHDDTVYTLGGVRLKDAPARGVYVRRGKKILLP